MQWGDTKSLGAYGALEPGDWEGETNSPTRGSLSPARIPTSWANSQSEGGGTTSLTLRNSAIRRHLSLMTDMTSPGHLEVAIGLKKHLPLLGGPPS